MQVTSEMAVNAVTKGQTLGIFPKMLRADDLDRLCGLMAVVLQAAINSAPASKVQENNSPIAVK